MLILREFGRNMKIDYVLDARAEHEWTAMKLLRLSLLPINSLPEIGVGCNKTSFINNKIEQLLEMMLVRIKFDYNWYITVGGHRLNKKNLRFNDDYILSLANGTNTWQDVIDTMARVMATEASIQPDREFEFEVEND